MKMPLCDNKKCEGYQKTKLEEGEAQSRRGPEDFDPILFCSECGTVFDIDDFVNPSETEDAAWDVDVDEDGPFITTEDVEVQLDEKEGR